MPVRKTLLVTGQYYHLFNRGVSGAPIFKNNSDYLHFLKSIKYYQYQNPPVRLSTFIHYSNEDQKKIFQEMEESDNKNVDIICYSLIPNHYHLLVLQTEESGITLFCKKFTDSYSRYYNTKHNRQGPLFQGVFKSVRIETTEQLLHVSRYIHLNPLVSFLVKQKDFINFPWSSLKEYLRQESDFIKPSLILDNFSSIEKYKSFILDQADYAKEIENIKHLIIEKEDYP